MIRRLRRVQREFLGLNRRNHGYLFRYNPRDGHRVVDDKHATKTVLARHGVDAPALLDVRTAVWQVAGLRARLDRLEGFVLKPARGSGGGGILVVVGREGGRFRRASGATMTWPAVAGHAADVIGGGFSPGGREDILLVEELVVAEPILGALAHRGVPDLRILVFRGVPVQGMLRLPTRRSDGRANLHVGGVGVGIALDSGRTTTAIVHDRPVVAHPDLGTPLAGHRVPCWDDVLLLATRAADAVGLGYLGVDVVLDARRGPLVLELNARPGLAIQLANRRGLRPLLDAVAAAPLPAAPAARVAFGRALASRNDR
ncbi:MAG: alpha-L-glutamate ligase-like protein [Candidatus Binatia bacterium]